MKATAVAPANIAFIKYWGKKDAKLRLPTNTSLSMNLSAATTTTTVEFSPAYRQDSVDSSDESLVSGSERQRVVHYLDRLRKRAGSQEKARVVTKNSFPKSAGIASSAAGFAALTVAGAAALGLKLSEKELTILARIGSGSACRSIPDGFVLWKEGTSSETSFAQSFFPPEYWDLRDILVIVEQSAKKIASTEGMAKATTSPVFASRLKILPQRLQQVLQALEKKNIVLLGEAIEAESINMHAVAMTQDPPLFYWNGTTIEIIQAVRKWREEGLPVYFTIDAGSSVHLICEAKNEARVIEKIKGLRDIDQIIINKPARGAHLIAQHLF